MCVWAAEDTREARIRGLRDFAEPWAISIVERVWDVDTHEASLLIWKRPTAPPPSADMLPQVSSPFGSAAEPDAQWQRIPDEGRR